MGAPTLGNAGFAVRATEARASSAAALFLHHRQRTTPLGGGCSFYLDAPVPLALAATTDAAGVATLPIPIPNDPALDGGTVSFQWAVADPQGAFLNLAAFSGRPARDPAPLSPT